MVEYRLNPLNRDESKGKRQSTSSDGGGLPQDEWPKIIPERVIKKESRAIMKKICIHFFITYFASRSLVY
ncbi:MAG: hypothetical protein A2666_04445 [Parcubacteria group bacterium RIFCSPHIGHO2_01_FULL_47_10b]|nr:MAG: hypothetical protein A2666_04445 [Parcubacteria group bacterium RIFCSPHIGHO2_01_FULL_47_10b]